MIEVRDVAGGATLRVRVSPRAPRDEVAGERNGALVVRLTAPPVEGQANAALVRFLARHLGVAPSVVSVAQGTKTRDKVLLVAGARAQDLRASLAR
ncbi:MAG TPA: DUF167 domain-containing protein [Vicinamibacteria bacterium]|jgi:uncharacterized protein (TIGR00251 family)|nr:DUF167 domain-containing protein [Vicinamibacteria bacterium]